MPENEVGTAARRNSPADEANKRAVGVIASGAPISLEDAYMAARYQQEFLDGEGTYQDFVMKPDLRKRLLAVHAKMALEWADAVVAEMAARK